MWDEMGQKLLVEALQGCNGCILTHQGIDATVSSLPWNQRLLKKFGDQLFEEISRADTAKRNRIVAHASVFAIDGAKAVDLLA